MSSKDWDDLGPNQKPESRLVRVWGWLNKTFNLIFYISVAFFFYAMGFMAGYRDAAGISVEEYNAVGPEWPYGMAGFAFILFAGYLLWDTAREKFSLR